tara:strand:- start:441 stop:620 length:180 start_codon:yes stop_codon:yes gene_type:complete
MFTAIGVPVEFPRVKKNIIEFPFPFLVWELTGGASSILLVYQKPTNKKGHHENRNTKKK